MSDTTTQAEMPRCGALVLRLSAHVEGAGRKDSPRGQECLGSVILGGGDLGMRKEGWGEGPPPCVRRELLSGVKVGKLSMKIQVTDF